MRLALSVERHPISGTWLMSAIVGTALVRRAYLYHTRREAIAAFRAEMRGGV